MLLMGAGPRETSPLKEHLTIDEKGAMLDSMIVTDAALFGRFAVVDGGNHSSTFFP